MHLRHAPLEIMTASREQLLRVPGIGPKTVDAILHARRQRRIREISQLRKLRIWTPEQVAPYILLDGQSAARQMSLF
jgi:predicted DNA-binding helix-hairpin-helix protein